MALRREDRPGYADAVWTTFQAKFQRGRLTMSSAEFMAVSRWMDRGIPLIVVLRALEDMKGSAGTLMACERPVEEAYRYWSQAMGLI